MDKNNQNKKSQHKKIKLNTIFTKEYIAFTQQYALNQSPEMRAFFIKVIRKLEKQK